MPTAVDRDLQRMVVAFGTNERVEAVVRRQQKRDEALIRLADDVRVQRVQLALEIREYLYRVYSRSDRPAPARPANAAGPDVAGTGGRLSARYAGMLKVEA